MTYRRDSDVLLNYGRFIPRSIPFNQNDLNSLVESRVRPVAWLVSNCDTNSKREFYVSELQKHIQVDIYGSCGMKCENCWEMIFRTYHFYLSFENSVCTDYCSEKLFNALKFKTVPVVLNRTQCFLAAPKNSFISADDFGSPSQLAAYLNFLMSNSTAYMAYLHWTSDYEISTDDEDYCALCQTLLLQQNSNPTRSPKSYENIRDWWVGRLANCQERYALRLFNNSFDQIYINETAK